MVLKNFVWNMLTLDPEKFHHPRYNLWIIHIYIGSVKFQSYYAYNNIFLISLNKQYFKTLVYKM